ncbi:MAG: DUF6513 domain-containing protein [Gammaproteobacteria bacterium]|nr:DUF6513 domain-containing protein [Gammaproteobacteria bacterium]
MTEKILFLTGKLAERSLHRVLESMQPTDFDYEVRQVGASVAALMTPKLIQKRLELPPGIDRILLPGRVRGDLKPLEAQFGVPVERGPDELKDIPTYFGRAAMAEDLTRYDVRIFAEITEAPNLGLDEILAEARRYREDGADIIDVGCLPGVEFPHLAETVQMLKQEDFVVSVDSLETQDLLTGGQAGADFLLSLKSASLWVADEVESVPILIGDSNTNLESLYACIECCLEKDQPFIADPILDPIHFGCADSIARYVELRRRYPDIQMMMGIGNLTELTHADTAGMNALLFGLISELKIQYALTTQVSEHCRTSLREADRARRIMRAAAAHGIPPKGIDDQLMMLHERHPFPYSPEEIAEFAAQVKDPNFRIQVTEDGVHLYNRDGELIHTDPLDFYPDLDLDDDPGHLFYLGIELTRAQIAWQLGKRYEQDEDFLWGCAVTASPKDLSAFREVGPTRQKHKDAIKHRKDS